jgi:exopolysaccharide biosynthesis WecB/TagA/CpsF family protein
MPENGKKNVVGVLIDPVDYQTATDHIFSAAKEGRGFSVSALAVHGVMTGFLDRNHRYRLNHFDMLVPDGQPVRWALNLLHKTGLRDRVYGPELTLRVLARAAREHVPVYFYGGTTEILKSLHARVKERFPGIEIAGLEASRFGRVDRGSADDIAARIKRSGARIVFAGLGCPRQEIFAFEFRDRLSVPVLAVGAAFPFIAGVLPQAPAWMQRRGLEWVFRWIQEPRRLWRRYLLLNPAYLALVAGQLCGIRFSESGEQPAHEMLYA